jgi:hypothetical protein
MLRFGREWGTAKPAQSVEEVTPSLLASWVPEKAETLSAAGDLVFEVVEPTHEDRDALVQLLAPGFGKHSKEIAEFMTMANPIPSFYEATVGPEGIDDTSSLSYRATLWLAMMGGAETGTDAGSETVVVRRLRIVGRRSAVAVAWDAPGGYPRYPSDDGAAHDRLASQLPGYVWPDMGTQARLRGDPEWLVELDHGIGHEGPSRVPQLLNEWENHGGSAGTFAEALFSLSVEAARQLVTEDLPSSLDRWESAVLHAARGAEGRPSDALRVLVSLGGMIDLVDPVLRNIGSPTADDPVRYFAPSPESATIERSAEDAISEVRNLRERVRTGLALVSAISTSRALEVALSSQSSSERFQRIVSVLGAAVLGPTLVVGLFGANTALPGKNTWWGFALMMILMVASAAALLAILRRLGPRNHETANAASGTTPDAPSDEPVG